MSQKIKDENFAQMKEMVNASYEQVLACATSKQKEKLDAAMQMIGILSGETGRLTVKAQALEQLFGVFGQALKEKAKEELKADATED